MDTIPSANLRQQKLEQQRLRIEQKQRQKREGGKLIQASDLKSASSVKRGNRPLSGRRELHGYEGPLQFLQGNNPDDMTTVQVLSRISGILFDVIYEKKISNRYLLYCAFGQKKL